MLRKFFLFLILASFFYYAYSQQTEARLLRFPSVMGNQVVFTYAGDLYTVPLQGGVARRLTSDIGYEMFAKISPDGKYIAFTAQYDGNTEVYLMPSDGGVPKRLTYTATLDRDDVADRMGPNNIVMTWTPDSKNIVFRSRCHSYNSFRGQLFTVSINGDMPKEIPILDGGFCSFNKDGTKLAFNKIFREFRTWKYYRGGMADDIWIYDFKRDTAYKLFENTAQDIFPMWYENKIFFLSDRDRIMNLFVYDLQTKKVKKITHFTQYDIKFPSIGGDKIVFENGGFLYYYDIKQDTVKKITVYIKNDYANATKRFVDASKYIRSFSTSPDSKKAVVAARGDIFIVPLKKGVTKNLTNTNGVHERNVVWSPDGKYIAYISDKSGEFEIYIQVADGSQPPIQLTDNAQTYKFSIKWSPDGKKIAWYDKLLRLRYIDIKTKKITDVDKSDQWEISQFNWSPDGRYITYLLPRHDGYGIIYIYDTKTGEKHKITEGWYMASEPNFSLDGKYLLFASSRDFSPIYSDVEWNAIYKDMERVYLVLLNKNVSNPFAPGYEPDGTDTVSNPLNVKVNIDFDGIENRIIGLPIRSANYSDIYEFNGKVYYSEYIHTDDENSVYLYDLNEKKETLLGKDFDFYLSWDGKKMIFKKDDKYGAVDLPSDKIDFENADYYDLSNMQVYVDYHKEWAQIFDEVWRQMRDFFYDPNMHGTDWKKIHHQYALLLPYVNHRNYLTHISGEMIGQLNVGHAYVGGGDRPEIKKVYTGLLGARFQKDKKTGYFKVVKILKGANWSKNIISPLTVPGVDVKEGDYIIAINGVPTNTVNNIYSLLVGKADKETELTVNAVPTTKNARKVVVVPLKSEAELYYYNWVQNNIRKVDSATNGQVGYIHIPDMLSHGLNEFTRLFYPQIRKRGLIIDDRGNGGGNVSPIIIERLRRQMIMQSMARNIKKGWPVPEETHIGPKVMLINEYSASDGDLFPYQFKAYKLGTIIGKRSWGGVVGIRGPLPLIDGGYLYKPEFGHFSKDGKKWIIEGHGVDPDIVVENNPADAFKGKDAQLEKAIEVIKEQIKNYPDSLTSVPPFPDKTK